MWIASLAMLGALAVAPPSPELPAVPAGVALGERVRLRLAGVDGGLVGDLVEADERAVTLRLDRSTRTMRVPRESIRRFERHRGRRRNVLQGAGLGAALGLMWIAQAGHDDPPPCPPDDPWCPLASALYQPLEKASAARDGLVLITAGAAIGFLVKTDRWQRVEPPRVALAIAPAGRRGAALRLSLRF